MSYNPKTRSGPWRRRGALAVVVTLVAALVLVILLAEGPEPVVPDPGTPGGATTASVQADLPTPPDRDPAPRERTTRRRVGTAPTPLGPGLRVRTVAAGTGRPLAGCRLLACDLGPGYLMDLLPMFAMDEARLLAWTADRGTVHTTNARGLAALPWPGGNLLVIAERDAWWGLFELDPADRETITLELRQQHPLQVQVVDGQGRPVPGEKVVLRRRRGPRTEDLQVVTADATGRARFAHPGWHMAQEHSAGETYSVDFAFPTPPGTALPLRPDRLPDKPLRLVLPPTGRLAITARGRDGELLLSNVYIQVGHAWEKGMQSEDPFFRATLPAPGGRLMIPRVGLGLQLRVAGFRGWRSGWTSKEVTGPVEPGEVRRVTLDFARTPPTLVCRLVDAQGRPIAHRSVRCTVESFHGDSSGWSDDSFYTDEKGRVAVELNLDEEAERINMAFQAPGSRAGGGGILTGTLELRPDLVPGEVRDKGDLVLRPAPPVFAGRVTTPDGRPIERVHVVQVDGKPLEAWTDAQGRFTLAGPIGVEVRHNGGEITLDHPFFIYRFLEEIPPGSLDLQVVLQPAGVVEGRVRIDPEVDRTAYNILISPSGPNSNSTPGKRHHGFTFTRVPPGLITLKVQVGYFRTPILRLDGIRVQGEAVADDPRLKLIDLRGRVERVTLRVTDPEGRPIRGATMHYGKRDFCNRKLPQGVRTFFFPKGSEEKVKITARGYLTRRVGNLRGTTTVVLQPGPQKNR